MSTTILPMPELTEQPTEHPHVVSVAGAAMLRGTRVRLRLIAQMYRAGDNVEDVLKTFPHLNAAAVHDAISYYLDHRNDIEKEIATAQIENALTATGANLDDYGFVRFVTN